MAFIEIFWRPGHKITSQNLDGSLSTGQIFFKQGGIFKQGLSTV